MLYTCNDHEAVAYCFTRITMHIVLHASRSMKPVIITAADTDVLVLLSHAYPQCNNPKQWLMKTNTRIFIVIKTICNFFGKSICQTLPGFQSITGCYTTSYPFGVGKINPVRRLSKMHLLQNVSKKHCLV